MSAALNIPTSPQGIFLVILSILVFGLILILSLVQLLPSRPSPVPQEYGIKDYTAESQIVVELVVRSQQLRIF